MEISGNEAVNKTLKRWHEIIASGDSEGLPAIVHPDVLFRSPVVYKPYHGRDALLLALKTVSQVFENFTYHRQFATDDGMSVTLEFSATVNGKELKGADFIKFDDEGLIVEFEVMVRPASGLMALGEEMGKRVGAKLATFK